MPALDRTFEQPPSVTDVIREGFSNWKARRHEAALTRSHELSLVREKYRATVTDVQTTIEPTALSIEHAVCEAKVHTTDIDAARAGLTTITSEAVLETALTEMFEARLHASVESEKPMHTDGISSQEPERPLAALFGGAQPKEQKMRQQVHDTCQELFGRLGIGAHAQDAEGITGIEKLHDSVRAMTDEKSGAMSASVTKLGISEKATQYLSSDVTTAIKANLIAATTGHVLELRDGKTLPPSIEKTLDQLTKYILADYQTGKLKFEHQAKIQQLWTRLESQMRQAVFEQRGERMDIPKWTDAMRKAAAETAFRSYTRAEQRAILAAMEDAKQLDLFSKISKKAITVGGLLVLGNMILTACNGIKPPGGTVTPIPVDTRDHNDQTPSVTPSVISPEITDTPPPVITGNLPDVTALSGIAPGVGGAGELVINPFDGSLQAAVNAAHFGVVHAGSTVSVESGNNGSDFCFSAIPATIYDPDHVSDPAGDVLVTQENGVAKYGYNQVLAEVLVPPDTATERYSCVLGYALDQNPDFKDGTLRMLLVRTQSDGSIDVVGSMQAGFGISDNVQVQHGVVIVNGNQQEWTYFPGMVEVPPTDRPAVMFAEMTGPEQCVQNLLQLDSPDYPQQLQAMMESIRQQMGEPATNLYLRPLPGTIPGTVLDIYPAAAFYFQSLDPEGHAPIATCGEIHLGDAVGRIQFISSFPFPTADGGIEPITFGLVHEPNAERTFDQESGNFYIPNASDQVIFPILKDGTQQVRLNFFVNSYYNQPENMDGFNRYVDRNIENTGSVIVPQLFNAQEQQHFSELFISVFYDGNRDPAALSELKALMENQLIPGFIFIDQP